MQVAEQLALCKAWALFHVLRRRMAPDHCTARMPDVGACSSCNRTAAADAGPGVTWSPALGQHCDPMVEPQTAAADAVTVMAESKNKHSSGSLMKSEVG